MIGRASGTFLWQKFLDGNPDIQIVIPRNVDDTKATGTNSSADGIAVIQKIARRQIEWIIHLTVHLPTT